MFLLQDFSKFIRLKNRINSFAFFLAFVLSVIFLAAFNLTSNPIVWLVSVIIFYFVLVPLLEKIFADKYFKNKKDIIGYIFYREYFGDVKFDIHKNFSKQEIEEFIEDLDCEEFILKNKIPTEYFFVKNENYTILKFESTYLQHYTRKILWENLMWKYCFTDNEGIDEYLETEYVNENGESIKEEIITDRIRQKSLFHLFLLFIIYDLKYGKRISLDRGFYMKKKLSFKIKVFD